MAFNVVDSWGEVKANACLVSYMNGYKDPRRDKYFTAQSVNKKTVDSIGVRSGSTELPNSAGFLCQV